MTAKEILTELIKHYSTVLQNINRASLQSALHTCYYHHVSNGICYAASMVLEVDIYNAKFVEKGFEPNVPTLMWYAPPKLATTTKEVVERLRLRVNKMQELLQRGDIDLNVEYGLFGLRET